VQRSYSWRPIRAARSCLLVALFFCLTMVGCSNYCFVFVSNPGGSISTSSSTPSCQLNSATGTVRLRVAASPAPEAQAAPTPIPTSIQHIFVTLRGIEATPSAIPNDDSPNWRELAPQLAAQPKQLDLLAHCPDSCAENQNMFAGVAVSVDAYRQIRLRLSSNQPAADEPLPEVNACGSVGFSCVITADGGIRALALDGLSPQFQISSDHISGGFFQVLPDTAINLDIEFNPQSSLFFPVNNAVRLVPTFTVEPQASSESTAALNQ
jgi:Domain of unknown function (DUF4382)